MPEITAEVLRGFVDSTTEGIAGNEEYYKNFLTWAGRFYNYRDPTNPQNPNTGYSIANQILIYSQDPKSRLCYTEEIWNKIGITVYNKEKPIYIIQHVSDNNYQPLMVYDIAHTNAEQYRDVTGKDIPSMCEAIIISSPCPIRFVKKLPNGKILLSEEGTMIQATNGLRNYEQMFMMLSGEMAHKYFYDYLKSISTEEKFDYRRGVHLYEAYSASFMVCSSMYLPVADLFNISQNAKWKGRSVSDLRYIRTSINMIVSAGRNIINNVTQELYNQKTAVYADYLYPDNENQIESEVT